MLRSYQSRKLLKLCIHILNIYHLSKFRTYTVYSEQYKIPKSIFVPTGGLPLLNKCGHITTFLFPRLFVVMQNANGLTKQRKLEMSLC